MASWRWNNYLLSRVPSSKTPLLISVDETSLCRFQGGGKGTVFIRKSVQQATLAQRRAYLSHVGVACNQPHLQRLLPQFIVGNERLLPARAMVRLEAAAPAYVRLVRQQSSWINSQLFASILRDIVKALQPYLDTYQIIFIFDAAPTHITAHVFRQCGRLGAWPMLVAANMTWCLQVLDTHAFSRYKRCVEGAYQDALAIGAVGIDEFFECVYGAIEEVIQSVPWQGAFLDNGFGANQNALCRSVRRHLQLEGPVSVSSDRPTDEDLRVCFPRGYVIPAAVQSWMALPAAPAIVAAAAASPGPSSAASSVAAPLPATARYFTRSVAAAMSAAPSSGSAPSSAPAVVAHRLLSPRWIPSHRL